ncbi:hypothetical protein LX36DRAFT_666506 [Colletotrichum falcatum]|nr:hypothetical protein LX36DRAFT_666506 [Colletotrichum falcatum]
MCIVFSTRAADFRWECPVSDVLYKKLKSWGWPGRCFLLKGHYRESSASYSNFPDDRGGQSTCGSPCSGEKPNVVVVKEDDVARRSRYEKPLAQIDDEGRVTPSSGPDPTASPGRARAMSQHEQDLEAEFRRCVPDLYRKVLDVQGNSGGTAAEPPCVSRGAGTETAMVHGSSMDHYVGAGGDEYKDRGGDRDNTIAAFSPDTKGPLVEYLDRNPTINAPRAELSKLAAENLQAYFNSAATVSTSSDDSYVKIAKGDRHAGDKKTDTL